MRLSANAVLRHIGNLPNSRSLRASVHTGVAISWIGVQFLVKEFLEMAGYNSLYDDRSSGIRWRFPHQCELLSRNDSVVRNPHFPLQIPICQYTYESQQLKTEIIPIKQPCSGDFPGHGFVILLSPNPARLQSTVSFLSRERSGRRKTAWELADCPLRRISRLRPGDIPGWQTAPGSGGFCRCGAGCAPGMFLLR